MKNFIGLIALALILSACSGGMSAHIPDASSGAPQSNPEIPNFDFTDVQTDPDLDVEFPDEVPTTTTTSISTTSTTAVTTTTIASATTSTVPGAVKVTTTTTKIKLTTTTTLQVKEEDEIVVVAPRRPGDEKNNTEIDFDPASIVAGATKDDFVGSSNLTPTIYYKPKLNENEGKYACSPEEKMSVLDRNEQELLKVCPKSYALCAQEGSCVVIQGDKHYPLNWVRQNKVGTHLFKIFDANRCPYGLGTRDMCLDPYYTIAADLSIYKEGDVIFVPAIVGTQLENGSKHHGFFVVRDRGGVIKTHGRFDFFTGYQSDTDPKNPFRKFKLGDVNTRLKYYLLKNPSKLGLFIKKTRGYPLLPRSHTQ